MKNGSILKTDKVVFVTGDDGFIGSHLTEMLIREGYIMKALSQYKRVLKQLNNKYKKSVA